MVNLLEDERVQDLRTDVCDGTIELVLSVPQVVRRDLGHTVLQLRHHDLAPVSVDSDAVDEVDHAEDEQAHGGGEDVQLEEADSEQEQIYLRVDGDDDGRKVSEAQQKALAGMIFTKELIDMVSGLAELKESGRQRVAAEQVMRVAHVPLERSAVILEALLVLVRLIVGFLVFFTAAHVHFFSVVEEVIVALANGGQDLSVLVAEQVVAAASTLDLAPEAHVSEQSKEPWQ